MNRGHICSGLVFLVAGCGGESQRDLRAWMQEQGKGVKGKPTRCAVKPMNCSLTTRSIRRIVQAAQDRTAEGRQQAGAGFLQNRWNLFPGVVADGRNAAAGKVPLLRTRRKGRLSDWLAIRAELGVVVEINDEEVRLKERAGRCRRWTRDRARSTRRGRPKTGARK